MLGISVVLAWAVLLIYWVRRRRSRVKEIVADRLPSGARHASSKGMIRPRFLMGNPRGNSTPVTDF